MYAMVPGGIRIDMPQWGQLFADDALGTFYYGCIFSDS